MTQSIPNYEPASVTAGDTITWSRSLSDYPASASWVLKYRLINLTQKYDITATASGDDHLVSVSASTSAGWAAGLYTWQAYVTKGTERHTIATGSLTVKPDLAAKTGGFETRSSAKQTLDLLDAAMIAYGAKAWTQEYEIAGRRMKFTSAGAFMAFRSQIVAEVAREDNAERIAAGLASKSKVYTRW